MSLDEKLKILEELTELPENHKNYILGYASGVLAVRAEQKEGKEKQTA